MSTHQIRDWWQSLEFLAPDVRGDLGRLIAQLERGLTSTAAPQHADEPAGWSGVARRGPWQRLLPSEWALAEAAPEEFLRRASEGELGFWELANEGLEQRRSVWVWLDVGPDQLGASRIVQIAIMLWLQQACRTSGGQFYWGTVQAPLRGYEQLRGEELRTYLGLRSVDPPRHPPEKMEGLQTWCVGNPAWIASLPSTFQRVALVQTGAELVELRHGNTALALRLPPVQRAQRLLRDPLIWQLPRQRANSAVSAAGNLAFSLCGRKLLVAEEHQIAVYPLPSSTSEPPGRPRAYPLPFPSRVIGLSYEGRAIHVVQERDDEWIFYRLNPAKAHDNELVSATAPAGLRPSMGSCWPSFAHWYFWVDDVYYHIAGGSVREIMRTCGGCQRGRRSLMATPTNLFDISGNSLFGFGDPPRPTVLAARSGTLQVGRTGHVIATELEGGQWRLLWKDQTADLTPWGNVVAVTADHHLGETALVVEKEGWLRLQGRDWQEPIDTSEKVRECLAHPYGLVAYRTSTGYLGCYSIDDRSTRWMAQE